MKSKIVRTRYGVPHITAGNLTSLGFGYGYAFAQDDLCTIADSYVTVAGQRSKYFGPDGEWTFSGNGTVNNNLDSDFYYRSVNRSGVIERLMHSAPPKGPLPGVKKVVRGYVRGYNAYLRRTGVDNLPDPRCRGASWVRPISAMDVYRRFYQLGTLASAGAALDGLGSAAPVLDPKAATAAEEREHAAMSRVAAGKQGLGPFPLPSGSNAIGLGSAATQNGRGMVLGNPHFPWFGSERLYQVAAARSRDDERLRRQPVRSPARADRADPGPRLVTHGCDGVEVHPLRAHPRTERPPLIRRGRQDGADEGDQGHRAGPDVVRRAPAGDPHPLLHPVRPDVQLDRGHPAAVDLHDGVGAGRRQRDRTSAT